MVVTPIQFIHFLDYYYNNYLSDYCFQIKYILYKFVVKLCNAYAFNCLVCKFKSGKCRFRCLVFLSSVQTLHQFLSFNCTNELNITVDT